MNQLVKLKRFKDVVEAETIRIRLQTAGINATVQGGETATTLSYIGSAVGYPYIEVDAADVDRATALLQADQDLLDTAVAWTCSRCNEHNEPAFEVCWSCNKTRDATDRAASPEPPDPFDTQTSAGDGPSDAAADRGDESNPYRVVGWATERPGESNRPSNEDAHVIVQRSERIERAFASALFGVFVPLGVFTIYSGYLLIAAAAAGEVTGHAIKWCVSWVLNALAILLLLMVSLGAL